MQQLPELYRAAFETSSNAYMIVDTDLRFVAVNAAYRAATHAGTGELVGLKVFERFPHDPADPNNESTRIVRESIERVFATGGADIIAAVPYQTSEGPDGGPYVRLWSATHSPIFDERGGVACVLQHTTDVTEVERLKVSTAPHAGLLVRAQKVQQANTLLGLEVDHFRNLFAQTPGFACFLRGPTHIFELANDAYCSLLGRSDLVGKSVAEAVPEVAAQGFLELLDGVFTSGQPFIGRRVRIELERVSGEPLVERILDFVYQPIVGERDEVIGIFVQGNDITEQAQLEQEAKTLLERARAAQADAEAASLLKDQFLATVSHELRTPLTAMLGWLQMLRSGKLPEDRRERTLDTIERNARAQAQLVEDILDVSRIISGKLHVETAPLFLAPVIDAALDAVRPAASSKSIALDVSVEQGAAIVGDASRLQQVVWNLLSNAVKFTPAGGRVEVGVVRRGDVVSIHVQDSGQGIEPEFLPHVFERFRQAEGSIARKHGGLGLGLAIAKQIVELHGGTVTVSSAGRGLGSRFDIELPIAPREHAGRDGEESPSPQSDGAMDRPVELRGLRILVVEDEADTRDLIGEILEQTGAVIVPVSSASEALELLAHESFDLLISDVGMPGEDGYTLMRKVRALPPSRGGRIPAVALTAYARAEDRLLALKAGFKAHVSKPIDLRELLAVLVSLVPPRP